MKKQILLLAISAFLISESNFILASSTPEGAPEGTEKKVNCSQISSNQVYELDDLDSLSQQAEDNGIKIEPIAKPTYLMSIVRKLGLIFFLKPYILFVDNYRIARNFIIKYSSMAWEKIVGKEPEAVNNGKKQE